MNSIHILLRDRTDDAPPADEVVIASTNKMDIDKHPFDFKKFVYRYLQFLNGEKITDEILKNQ